MDIPPPGAPQRISTFLHFCSILAAWKWICRNFLFSILDGAFVCTDATDRMAEGSPTSDFLSTDFANDAAFDVVPAEDSSGGVSPADGQRTRDLALERGRLEEVG